MGGKDEEKPKNLSDEEEKKLLKLASERLKKAATSRAHSVKDAIESLEFGIGKQWAEQDINDRKLQNRSTLTVNLLHKYIEQVVGDMRKSKLSINVRPKSSADDQSIAAVHEGLLAGIEAESRAERIYDAAGESQIKCGFGAWRILNEYESWDSFDQVCRMELIENPFSVLSDPDTRDANGLDKQWCFVLSRMTKDEYEEQFPDSPVHKDWPAFIGTGMQWEHWWDGEAVAKAEYYVREKEEVEMALLSNGDVMEIEDAKKAIAKHEKLRKELVAAHDKMRSGLAETMQGGPPLAAGAQQPPPPPGIQAGGNGKPGGSANTQSQPGQPTPPPTPEEITIVDTRKSERFRVKRYVLTINEIIEGPVDVPGEYIPIVEIHGKRTNIQGKRFTYGLIQFAKDPQRFFNYQITTASELTRLTPKSPYLVTPEMISGFENIWAESGSKNVPYLPFHPDDRVPSGPRREPPVQLGDLIGQITMCGQFIRDTIGNFHDSAPPSRDQSGESLKLLEEGQDDSTYSFLDNLVAGVEATGIILLSQIPEVYDTERDVKIAMPNGTESFVPINTTARSALQKAGQDETKYAAVDKKKLRRKLRENPFAKYNDMSDGRFAVRVSVGPSFQRQRRETVDVLLKAGQYYPPIANAAGDIVAQNLPLPQGLNEELTRRLRKIMAQGGLIKPDPGEEPMPPPPQMVLAMKKLEIDAMKGQAAIGKAKSAEEKVKTDAATKQMEIQSKEKIEAAKLGQAGQQHAAEMGLDKQRLMHEAYLKLQELFAPQQPINQQ